MIYKARVPTNIAFLKYWGKENEEKQWPSNDSLSMTLDLYSETHASLNPFEQTSKSAIYFSSDKNISDVSPFLKKGLKHLKFLSEHLGFKDTLYIQSYNEFPSGCGLASSASGLASLTLAAIGTWTQSASLKELEDKGFTRKRLAELSRLGSGSACRSLWGGFVLWEKGASPELQNVGPFAQEQTWQLCDSVIIVSDQEKSVSSTEGHRLAKTSPLFKIRMQHVPSRLEKMKAAILKKDLQTLGPLLEDEALEMHEVMATSQPPCVYMTESTLSVLEYIAHMRHEKHLPFYFTLDAGPNVHVIYEEHNKEKVLELLKHYKTINTRIGSDPIFFSK